MVLLMNCSGAKIELCAKMNAYLIGLEIINEICSPASNLAEPEPYNRRLITSIAKMIIPRIMIEKNLRKTLEKRAFGIQNKMRHSGAYTGLDRVRVAQIKNNKTKSLNCNCRVAFCI